jgi:hypothetical protein
MSYKSARFYEGRRWGATKDPVEIEQDWRRWPHANVCIVTGAISGIFVVEIDTPTAHGVDGAASLAALEARFGALPLTRQALSPSGSRHFYFRWPSGGVVIRNSTGRLGPGIDVRGEGGMAVAPPSVRADGVYQWVKKALIANAPPWMLAQLMERPYRQRIQEEAELVHPALVTATVEHVPTELNWHQRNRIGMAIFACTGGSQAGLAIWDAWLQKSGKYNARATQQRWAALHRCPPNNIGYGTLMYLATRANPNWLAEFDRELMETMRQTNRRGIKRPLCD